MFFNGLFLNGSIKIKNPSKLTAIFIITDIDVTQNAIMISVTVANRSVNNKLKDNQENHIVL